MIVYLLLINSFGSFAGRFLNMTIFLILISALFRRENVSSDHVV